MQKREIYLILDNIRSIHNVGSIFRTAACAGVKEIFICGYTPEPKDRFGRWRKDLAKVSLGGEREVPYQYFKNTREAISALKEKEVAVIAIEQAENSVPLYNFKPHYPLAYILGNEVDGISEDILEIADEIVEIPLRSNPPIGGKESLNVSVAAGIILFTKY